ncbi:MAG: cytidine deaminase [Terriglobales bacterium]
MAKATRRRSKPRLSAGQRRTLLNAARDVMRKAYAPFSKFLVGAAILTDKGAIYAGCNVENSSYGLTNCAERTAIFTAVATEGKRMKVRAVAVVNGKELACSPCGACRQVIFEFGPDAVVLFRAARGWKELHIHQLLPESFRL